MRLTAGQARAANLLAWSEGNKNLQGKMPTSNERARAQFALAESVASGEFPAQILPAVRRTLTAVYDQTPVVHDRFTTRKTVAAINVDEEVNVYSFGDQQNLAGTHAGDLFVPGTLPTLLPRQDYPEIGFAASGKKVRARKIGEAFGIDWEAIVRMRGTNANMIREAYVAFGRHARQTEDVDVAKLLVGSTGFRTAAGQALNTAKAASTANGFSVANADLSNPEDVQRAIALSNTARLTVGSDAAATNYQLDVSYTDFALLCAPEAAPRLRQILNARTINRSRGSAGGTEWQEQLDFGGDIEVIGWKWLKTLWPTIGKGWILVPKAAADDLPILTSNYLEGAEAPQTFVKNSNQRRVDGGEVNPEVDGDFESDGYKTKVRHVHGATALWTDGIVYSTGANA